MATGCYEFVADEGPDWRVRAPLLDTNGAAYCPRLKKGFAI
jgi:hypothetical protein